MIWNYDMILYDMIFDDIWTGGDIMIYDRV